MISKVISSETTSLQVNAIHIHHSEQETAFKIEENVTDTRIASFI